jgi:hypothetical protein
MALVKGIINPLNVLGQRRLSYIPEHFSVMKFADITMMDKIDQWINDNLNSRYCVKLKQSVDSQRKIISICEIGIEDHKELSMLGLACPYLHKK